MKILKQYIVSHSKILVSLSVILLFTVIFLSFDSGQAHAVTLSDIPPDILTGMAGYDDNTPTPNNNNEALNCKIGGTNYGQSEWSWLFVNGQSSADDGTSGDPFTVASGSQLDLDIADLIFLCHSATDSDEYFTNVGNPEDSGVNTQTWDDPATRLNSPSVGNPGPSWPDPPGTWLSEVGESQFGAPSVVSGPGSISGGVAGSNPQTIDFQDSTRYWFPDAETSTFVYNAPTTAGNYSVEIRVPIYEANEFDPGLGHNVYNCVVSPQQSITAAQFGNPEAAGCNVAYAYFSVQINVTEPVQAESNVYSVNSDGSGYTQVPGVSFNTCGNGSPTQGTYGYYYFTVPNVGDGYCVRLTGTAYNPSSPNLPGYDGPFIRPFNNDTSWEDAYPSESNSLPTGVNSTCGPFGFPLDEQHCGTNTPSYECQTAGGYQAPDECGYKSLDRESDWGFDFNYVGFKPTPTCTLGQPGCTATSAAPSCTIAPTATVTADKSFTVEYTITNNAAVTPLTFTTASNSPYSTTFSGGSSIGISFEGPATYNGNTVTLNPGQTFTASFTNSTGISYGQYSISMDVNAYNVYGGGTITDASCNDNFDVVAEPYLRAFGGDVMAGVDSQYINSCYDGTDSNSIESYNNGGITPNANGGGGTTNANLGTQNIGGFASDQYNSPFSALDLLTFANIKGYGGSPYGGSFGTSPCSPTATTYYDAVSNLPPSETHNSCQVNSSNPYYDPLVGAIVLSPGDQYICYTTSNVTVSSSVEYNLSGATATNLPVFEVVVQGADINIADTVYKLAGTYIAEDSGGTGGIICDNVTGGGTGTCQVDEPKTGDDLQNNSHEDKLTIDGSFIANQIDLYRSEGTLNYAPAATIQPDNEAAEEFDYSPVNWLAPSSGSSTPVPAIQSVTSLPPVY